MSYQEASGDTLFQQTSSGQGQMEIEEQGRGWMEEEEEDQGQMETGEQGQMEMEEQGQGWIMEELLLCPRVCREATTANSSSLVAAWVLLQSAGKAICLSAPFTPAFPLGRSPSQELLNPHQ